jgi:hypothetical protein
MVGMLPVLWRSRALVGKSVPQIQAILPLLLQNNLRQLSLPPEKEITLLQLRILNNKLNSQKMEIVQVDMLPFWK